MNNYQTNQGSLLIMNNNQSKMDIYPLRGDRIRMGRGENSTVDLKLNSSIVSDRHGMFRYIDQRGWYYKDVNSTNGTFVDGRHIIHDSNPQRLDDGSVLRIDSAQPGQQESVTMVFCQGDYSNQKWTNYPLDHLCKTEVFLGRDPDQCDLYINSISLTKKHGRFYRKNDELYYQDLGSTNGSFVNNLPIKGEYRLQNKDVFLFGNIKMIYSEGVLFYTQPDSGTNLIIRNLTKEVNDSENFGHKKIILNNVNLDIKASELVAVIGTSGAGKTTFLNCVNGYEEATSGSVFINNMDFYKSATRF